METNAPSPKPTKKKREHKERKNPLLRDLPISDRYFWKDDLATQLSFSVSDRGFKSDRKSVPDHEVSKARKYARRAVRLTSLELQMLMHASRRDFPTIIFTHFVPSNDDRQAFFRHSHRGRYLRSSALMNPPHASTSVFASKYISYEQYPLYITSAESLVVIAGTKGFYTFTNAQAGRMFGKMKRVRGGPDPGSRLQTPSILWQKPSADADVAKLASFEQHRRNSLEDVYEWILACCTTPSRTVQPSFSGREFQSVLPRAPGPSQGQQPLGTPLPGESRCPAEPPSRLGEKKKKSRKRKREQDETSGMESEQIKKWRTRQICRFALRHSRPLRSCIDFIDLSIDVSTFHQWLGPLGLCYLGYRMHVVCQKLIKATIQRCYCHTEVVLFLITESNLYPVLHNYRGFRHLTKILHRPACEYESSSFGVQLDREMEASNMAVVRKLEQVSTTATEAKLTATEEGSKVQLRNALTTSARHSREGNMSSWVCEPEPIDTKADYVVGFSLCSGEYPRSSMAESLEHRQLGRAHPPDHLIPREHHHEDGQVSDLTRTAVRYSCKLR
ncbi:uncharacterized protein MYCFIDRAFT_180416 [Pseudocercospora fijiensis CIRAD86]|uniref:Uncharacterized protein n=1 Tax=Pseudocercospora fijiensis (strain CIRAD86) TaxID=383855 RepID=M3AIR0_PSEFD|nr:uncharacterized protein MYCFIDRAFT_180416 [Pseudocercospora fijiensis CIRAD86]EME77083.1 hypothetical protein MYCFIDRAFT_180416 [Pseudocercospora fijiensis CIRAD86]